MSEVTKIEWTDHTWNPWIGCTKVSPGCANCYAEVSTPARTFSLQWGKGRKRQRTSDAYWRDPVRWHNATQLNIDASHDGMYDAPTTIRRIARPRVFPSLCDWLDDEVPIKWLEDFLSLIVKTQSLDWLLLTKRPENLVLRLREVQRHCTVDPLDLVDRIDAWISGDRIFHNVWLGVSAENQTLWNQRVAVLKTIPASVHFISAEPLLSGIDCGFPAGASTNQSIGIDWVIVGGESGPKARPCNVTWIEAIVDQCREAGVACFVKQLGSVVDIDDLNDPTGFHRTYQHDQSGQWYAELKHPKGGDPAEWPERLRVREFPGRKD